MIQTATLLSRARNVISDTNPDPTALTFSETELSDIVSEVIIEYSGFRPYRQQYTFSTVKGQDIYQLPSDANWVRKVTQVAAPDLTFLYNAYTYDFYSAWVNITEMMLNDRSLFAVRQDAFELFTERGEPSWSVWNDKQIILYPAPLTDGYNVLVEYGSIHAPDGSGNYPTIPDQDIVYLRRLVEAQCLDTIATAFSLKGDYSEGQTKVQFHPEKLRIRADALRANTQNALADAVAARA